MIICIYSRVGVVVPISVTVFKVATPTGSASTVGRVGGVGRGEPYNRIGARSTL